MKKNDWILLLATALYSYMFYEQLPGINFLVFTLALTAALYLRDRTLLKSKNWLLAAAGSLLSAACVAWHGTNLSVMANIISLSLLSGLSVRPATSLLFALLFSAYSYVSAIIFMLVSRPRRKPEESEKEEGRTRRFTLLLIPFLITLVFFFMYRGSNVLFNEFAKKISFDFISWDWIVFTLTGTLLLYGFFHHRVIKLFAHFDRRTGNDIHPHNTKPFSLFGKPLSTSDENFSGVALFLMLNILLLIVNALDFNFLFIDGRLPADLTYSQFVHQGTGMLITSIIFGILIILFYFRGALNFYEKNGLLRLLAYLWIIQNVFVLYSTSLRNEMYIHEYGLTYKRIGVYVYLFLTLIGLCTTLIKLAQTKNNMFLFRINGALFYATLLASCMVNWDILITDFNIKKAGRPDKQYLLSLSWTNLPQLYDLESDSLDQKFIQHPGGVHMESDLTGNWYRESYEAVLDRKLFRFAGDMEAAGWQSWSNRRHQVLAELVNKNRFAQIQELDLSSQNLSSLEGLAFFTNVRKLNLYDNSLKSVEGLTVLTALEELDLGGNPVNDFTPLLKLKKLRTLQISNLTPHQMDELRKKMPETKITN